MDGAIVLSHLRKNLREMATIIFSVVVALQFQDWHERSNNTKIGHNAATQIEEEIAFNRANVAASADQLFEVIETMRARQEDAKTLDLQTAITLSLPAFFSGAYDAAVSAGAMRHLPAERAATIARIYKLQNWIALIQERTFMLELDPVLALAPDTADNRYRQFTLVLTSYSMLERHFRALIKFYDAFLAGQPTPSLTPKPPI